MFADYMRVQYRVNGCPVSDLSSNGEKVREQKKKCSNNKKTTNGIAKIEATGKKVSTTKKSLLKNESK